MKLCLRCNQYFDEPVEKCPSDGAILENVGKDPLIGALINNRYLVDSVIGKGSSGIVYKARRLGRGEVVVAIKVLHSYIGAAGSSLDRFLREAQAASRLRNPHIITIWESGVTEDGQPYFVMDYLEGTTLGHLIKDKVNLDPVRVLALLHQICEALSEAHRQGIVHRDLKPENVVLQESGHGHDYIKLLDFGIADSPQHAQSSYKLEKPKTVSGSPAYMSPEQCQGLELDGRSDIYSLAIVVFEMLTGQRPFPQKDNVNVMVLHVNEPPMVLADVRPDLNFPEAVEQVIGRALSKQPNDRQATVHEFLAEFERAWQNSDHPATMLVKVSEQSIPSQPAPSQAIASPANCSNQLKEIKHENEITSDDLGFQGGDGSLAAWGNVSIQSSGKTTTLSAERRSIFDSPETSSSNPDVLSRNSYLVNIWNAVPEAVNIAPAINNAAHLLASPEQTSMAPTPSSNAHPIPAAQIPTIARLEDRTESSFEQSFDVESNKPLDIKPLDLKPLDISKAKHEAASTAPAINSPAAPVVFPDQTNTAPMPMSSNAPSVPATQVLSIAGAQEKTESSFEQSFGVESKKALDIKSMDVRKPEPEAASIAPLTSNPAPPVTFPGQTNMAPEANNAHPIPVAQASAIAEVEEKIEANFVNTASSIGPEMPAQPTPSLNHTVDPSATGKNKTIERLMEAAKRGQTGAHSIVSAKRKIPTVDSMQVAQPMQPAQIIQRAQALQATQPTQPTQSTQSTKPTKPTQLMPQMQSNKPLKPDEMLARLVEQSKNSQSMSATPSGWYPLCEENSFRPESESGLSSAPTSELNHSVAKPTPSMSLSGLLSPKPSPSEQLSRQYTQPSVLPDAEIPSEISVTNIQSERHDLKVDAKETQPSSNDRMKVAEIYIKQKYRGTLSRLQSLQKPTRADSSLIATKVRTASLHADSVKPPKNLWHIAIAIVVTSCVLASLYVVFSVLSAPIPPVTSIDTLLAGGNNEKVMDILEGKSLSMPLTSKEKDQLSYTYLTIAKSYISKKKPEQALSFLAKIAPSSSSAGEGNQLKGEIKKSLSQK